MKLWDQKISDLELELKEYRASGPYLDQIRQILRSADPNLDNLMDVCLKQDREKQEWNNFKALEILKSKDAIIENLNQKLVEVTKGAQILETEVATFESKKQDIKSVLEREK